jgi:hypothetical protein
MDENQSGRFIFLPGMWATVPALCEENKPGTDGAVNKIDHQLRKRWTHS